MKSFYKIDLQHIARYTNWQKKKIEDFLNEKVYPSQQDWIKFTTLAFLALGIGLFCIGIIFFFAYNWNQIPGTVKLILIFSLTSAFSLISLYNKLSLVSRQLCLTAAATMVGVLFAVFGQIYQTGANAYDFFLAWAIFSLLWVITAKFLPLWILYFLLLNTTLYFYFVQIKPNIDISYKTLSFLLLNTIPVVFDWIWLRLQKEKINKMFSFLFSTIVVELAAFYISYCIIDNHFEQHQLLIFFISLLIIGLVGYIGKFYRQTFYYAIISIGFLAIGISCIGKVINDVAAFFIIALFVITYVTASIYFISNLQKKWKDGASI